MVVSTSILLDLDSLFYFASPAYVEFTLDKLRAVLTADGRTLAQAALGWLWARSPVTVPIPGFKNIHQVEENVGALVHGPLTQAQMIEIESLIARSAG